MIQGFSPFLYVPAKSKCKTTFAPGNLQVFSLPQSQKFPQQFLPQKPHRENAPTVFGGCITKRLPGFRFAVGGYRFVNSPFVMFWVQMVKNHGIYCAFEKPVLKYKSYTLKWVFVTISGFRPHQLVAEKKGVAIMAVRILWDRYEVALLINIYERVTDGADIHSEAEKLSATLWSLAIRRGLSIDDTYRNVNGMKM